MNLYENSVELGRGESISSTFGRLLYRMARPSDGPRIVEVINLVAGERRYLQTTSYVATPEWEQLLASGTDIHRGLILGVVQDQNRIAGFIRVTPGSECMRHVGNIGIALLPSYRYGRIGTGLLARVITHARHWGFRQITANVLLDNSVSLRLFLGRGFQFQSLHLIHVPFSSAPVPEAHLYCNLLEEE